MNNFSKLKKELVKIISQASIEEDPWHAISTLNWLLILHPEASEELQIAALAHDIDRAIEPITIIQANETHDEYKVRHAERSAQLVTKLMSELQFAPSSITKVKSYIENHETGGDPETESLKDADSISFFDYNINFFYRRKGHQKTKDKINYMYSRASDQARQIILMIPIHNEIKRIIHEVVIPQQ